MFVNAALLPLSLGLITPFDPSLFSASSCLADSYYGTYAGNSVFLSDSGCLLSNGLLSDVQSGSIVPMNSGSERLLWIQQQAIEHASPFEDELSAFQQLVQRPLPFRTYGSASEGPIGQTIYESYAMPEILFANDRFALLSASEETARIIDTIVPSSWEIVALPDCAIPYTPVSSSATDFVKALSSSLEYDEEIASIVNDISFRQLIHDVRYLTGEASNSPIVSRHSFAEGSRVAAEWLKNRFEETGAECELQTFLSGFAPNVVCRYSAYNETDATVLLSAHYDSRGSFGSVRAPGGDDDGSGVGSLLAIARTIGRKNLAFHSNVELTAFAGEEQGLYGSSFRARMLREADANITLMIQADMIGYHAPGEPPQLGLPTIGSLEVAELITKAANVYSPELKVGTTTACCSDHQPFHEQGYPAMQVFERAGPIADPMYHNSGDLTDREGYDFDQVVAIARVQFATMLHAAGFHIRK